MSKSTPRPNRQDHWVQHLTQLTTVPAPRVLWLNPLRPNHSLRLTLDGRKWVTELCALTVYKFDIEPLSNRQLLQLDHLFNSPYFLQNRKTIYLFGEQDAIMLSLHGNDLGKYLDTLDID